MSSLFGIGAGSASTGFYPETIDQSLRLDGTSAHLSKTYSTTASSTTDFVMSLWFKAILSGTGDRMIASSYDGSTVMMYWQFQSDRKLRIYIDPSSAGSNEFHVTTDMVFRDSTNWYNICLVLDMSQSSNVDKAKIYVNGTQASTTQTYSTGTPTTQNVLKSGTTFNISKYFTSAQYIDGYIAEVNIIDGSANYTDFGESKNGVWIPKAYTGSYGNNGARLTFADSSSLGDDTSGNGNDFTSSGLASTDVVLDSPTNNFATMNVLLPNTNTYQEGNLKSALTTQRNSISTIAMPNGKWYAEFRVAYSGNINVYVGVFKGTNNYTYPWNYTRCINQDGGGYATDSSYSSAGTYGTFANTTIVGIYYDSSNGQVKMQKSDGSGGVTLLATITDANYAGEDVFFAFNASLGGGASGQVDVNFGQNGTFNNAVTAGGNSDENNEGNFFLPVPSGFLALCSSNLSDSTLSPNQLEQATDYMDTAIWSGDSSSSRNIDLYDFQPDWVWIKNRGAANVHITNDSSRGVSTALDKALTTNETDSEGLGDTHTTSAQYGDVSAFRTNGFTLKDGTIDGRYVNAPSNTYVGWAWKAGGTAPTKTYKVVVVSDSGNKYRFRNSADSATFAQSGVTLDLQEGGTYVFDWSDSSAQGHPFRFSTTSDGTHGGGSEYTTGVVKDDSAYTTTITVASSAPQLYFYCSIHSGMGGSVNTNSTFGSTNFDGSILSVEQASTEAGFGIVTYTANNTANTTIGHGLGAVPKWLIIKKRSATQRWFVWHTGDATEYMYLNGNFAGQANLHVRLGDDSSVILPTDKVITLGGHDDTNDPSGATYVAYVFAPVEGYSKFGSYVGNNSTDGTFVYTGFRPAWIMFKRADSADNWAIFDVIRDTINPLDSYIYADNFNTEATFSTAIVDALSNGFKWRGTVNFGNASGGTYIYMAFAEQPFKFSNAR